MPCSPQKDVSLIIINYNNICKPIVTYKGQVFNKTTAKKLKIFTINRRDREERKNAESSAGIRCIKMAETQERNADKGPEKKTEAR